MIFRKIKRLENKMANQEKLEAAVYQLLEALGEDPKREGLLDTPKRVAKMYQEMFSNFPLKMRYLENLF